MFGCLSRPQLAWLACLAVYLGPVEASVAATTNLWTNSVSGLWRTGSNWSSGVPPDSTFAYILITNAGTKTVTIDATTPLTNLAITNLTISAPAGSTNTLALVDATTNLPLQLSRALIVDRRGALYITNSALRATSGLGNFDLVAGNTTLDSGLIDCST